MGGRKVKKSFPLFLYADGSYVGRVVQTLKKQGLWSNTLLVLTSDNGGPIYMNKPYMGAGGGNNYPLRGGKGANLEGGVRTNALISGGYVPRSRRGQVEQGLIGLEDWYTTFCALAGVDPSDHTAAAYGLPPVDGVNQWPLLSGKNSTPPRSEIWLGAADPLPSANHGTTLVQGLIDKDGYKILVGPSQYGIWQGPYYPNASSYTDWNESTERVTCGASASPAYPYPGACLFNVFDDPTEHNDLSTSNPSKLAQLTNRLKEVQDTVFSPNRGQPTGLPCNLASTVYQGYYGPWLEVS